MQELKFTALRYDDFLCEVLVYASNGSFSGKVKVILAYEKCTDLIGRLKDFPKNISDEVALTSNDELNHSSLGLYFYCRDNLGNPSVSVSLQHVEIQSPEQETNKATVVVHCDPEGIDTFCRQLGELLAGDRSTAQLTYGAT